ncbi:hypothetical protein ESZ50_01350 [Weissella muntiaci]|uniref:HK97 gp10 family phage protein n=1 Tax=Weissella muntiaci TaxID=2508881 RepID=A0A6C2C9V0_9LACO|nr:hypothetical protein [Weissella muntiaci]TYC50890.1 hypothetical protein ESZ50_01350 [Weissella muntiaci]
MSSGVQVEGMDQIKKNLERKLGRSTMLATTEQFAKKAGVAGQQIVRSAERSYQNTGKSVQQTTYKVQRGIVGGHYVRIGWKGNRKPLVHLNELGYTKKTKGGLRRIQPRGMGKIEDTKLSIGKTSLELAKRLMKEQMGK